MTFVPAAPLELAGGSHTISSLARSCWIHKLIPRHIISDIYAGTNDLQRPIIGRELYNLGELPL